MNFQEVEKTVSLLRTDLSAGRITEEQFKTRLKEMMVQDERGDWWMIGYETDLWYRHNGKGWVRANPPGYVALKVKPSTSARNKSLKVFFQGLLFSFVLGWVVGGFIIGGMLGAADDESLSFAIIIWVVGFFASIIIAIQKTRTRR